MPTSDGAVLWVAVEGSGPPIVLCHGGPGLWDYLGSLAGLLRDEFTVYRWDQRACGRSTPGSSPLSVQRTLEDLDELRQYFRHERWSVIGHSWGADIALLYGLLFDARSACVTYLSGTGPKQWWRQTGREAYRVNRARRMTPQQNKRLSDLSNMSTREVDQETEFRILSWMTDFNHPESSEELTDMVHTDLAINSAANRLLANDELLDTSSLRARCEQSPVPVLICHGADDPRPAKGSALFADWIPTATLEIITGAGHLPWVEQPAVIEQLLKLFLRTCTSAPKTNSPGQ